MEQLSFISEYFSTLHQSYKTFFQVINPLTWLAYSVFNSQAFSAKSNVCRYTALKMIATDQRASLFIQCIEEVL